MDGTLIISKGDGANRLHKLAFASGMKKARVPEGRASAAGLLLGDLRCSAADAQAPE